MNESPNGNGNGHTNGKENGKIFDLVKAQDPLLSHVVPQARESMCFDTRICEAARMFFCFLTDASLKPGVMSRRGVVKFSDSYLAARFKVSDKTIRNWKRAIESTGRVWLTEKFMKNSFPQTVYNIAAIVGQATLPLNSDSEDGSLAEDEIWSSNRRRQKASGRVAESGKFACRLHGQSGCPICRQKTPPPYRIREVFLENPKNAQENDTAGKILPPTAAIYCRRPRQPIAVESGKPLPTRESLKTLDWSLPESLLSVQRVLTRKKRPGGRAKTARRRFFCWTSRA